MKNKCCTTCRIYNWDYIMMFTPLLFLVAKPGPILHYILIALALVILIIWEITYKIHPERFTENTNENLTCKNCKEKLCQHHKQFPCKDALIKNAQDKTEAQEKIEK